jgi:putative ABC transport system permease protein
MLFARAELGRSKLRFTGLTLGAGLLIFVLLFQQALLAAVLDGMAGAVKHQSGPVIVFTKDARRNFGAGSFAPEQIDQIKAVPGAGAVSGLGLGLLSYRTETDPKRTNVAVIGYQPGQPGTPTAVVRGRLPGANDEIVVSAEGAQGRYAIGDTLTFEPGGVQARIVGLTEESLFSMGPAVWMPWPTFEVPLKTLATKEGQDVPIPPAVLAVQPAPGTTTDQLITNINLVAGVDAMTASAAAEAAPGRAPIESAFLTVMLLCYVVVGVVIGFFFLTITLQKEASITMLRAVGANAGYLISCLLYEVAVVMTGGVIVGILVLVLVKPLLANIVILTLDPLGIVVTALPALGVALLGTLPPIRRMLRTDPNAVVSRPALGSVR